MLYQKMKDFTVAAVNLLNDLFKNGKMIPVVNRYQFYISNGKFMRGKRYLYPLFERFVFANQDLLMELSEFKKCMEYCRQSEIFQKHLFRLSGLMEFSKENVESYLENEFLFLLLAKLLHSVEGLRYDEDEFDKLYCQIESYLESQFMHLAALVPIKNFELKGQEVILDEDAKVSSIESQELNLLIGSGNLNLEIIDTVPPYALKINFFAEKGLQVEYQIPFKKIQKVFCTFRMFKKGALGFDHIYCIPLSWEPTKPLSFFINQSAQGSKYILEEKEGTILLQIWKNFNDLKTENRFIEIAIEKFDNAVFRQRAEDKLVDYISAIEALFLGADEKAELEYRLALRIATFIGESSNERVFIRNILKAAYAQRSCIVHGKKLKITQINGKRYSIEDLSVHLEDYTRRSLQKFIEMAARKINHEELLDRLDDALLKFPRTPFSFEYSS